MVYEWIYALPNLPKAPAPRGKNKEVTNEQWGTWLTEWITLLLDQLEVEDDDPAIEILVWMIQVEVTSRWSAAKCLEQGFSSRLFERREAHGLVGRASDRSDLVAGWGLVKPKIQELSSLMAEHCY